MVRRCIDIAIHQNPFVELGNYCEIFERTVNAVISCASALDRCSQEVWMRSWRKTRADVFTHFAIYDSRLVTWARTNPCATGSPLSLILSVCLQIINREREAVRWYLWALISFLTSRLAIAILIIMWWREKHKQTSISIAWYYFNRADVQMIRSCKFAFASARGILLFA